jgi:hypothetical protein
MDMRGELSSERDDRGLVRRRGGRISARPRRSRAGQLDPVTKERGSVVVSRGHSASNVPQDGAVREARPLRGESGLAQFQKFSSESDATKGRLTFLLVSTLSPPLDKGDTQDS